MLLEQSEVCLRFGKLFSELEDAAFLGGDDGKEIRFGGRVDGGVGGEGSGDPGLGPRARRGS